MGEADADFMFNVLFEDQCHPRRVRHPTLQQCESFTRHTYPFTNTVESPHAQHRQSPMTAWGE